MLALITDQLRFFCQWCLVTKIYMEHTLVKHWQNWMEKVRKIVNIYFDDHLIMFIKIGCGYDPREWWDENTGLNQIVTIDK